MNNLQKNNMVPITELLDDIIDNRGKSCPTCDSGFPLIATNCIKKSSIYPTFENIRFVSLDTLKTWFRAELKPNDILFVNKGTPGRVCLVPDPVTFCVAQDMIGLRVNSTKVYYKYLFAVLRSNFIQEKIANFHVGIAIPHFKKSDMDNLLIPLPDMNMQIKVGDFYCSLSEKIENNNKIISELESMAKTIYDYWFLQFDFPDENGKPYKSSGGKMVWNEELKKEIPEGWEYKPLIDIEGNIITGKTPPTTDLDNYNGNIPFITIGDMRNNVYIVKTVQTLSTKGANSQLRKYLPKNSLVVSCIATIGLVSITTQNSQTNQQINGIVLSCSHNLYFLYFALKKHFINSVDVKTGNTFSNMNKNEFSGIKFLYNKDYVKLYYEKVKVIFDFIKNAQLENQELASIRDFLLPMLMNGQVTFKESK